MINYFNLAIADQPNMKVIAEAEYGVFVVELPVELLPAIIMDLFMSVFYDIGATRHVLVTNPGINNFARLLYVDKYLILAMPDAEASGYLLKKVSSDWRTTFRSIAINNLNEST